MNTEYSIDGITGEVLPGIDQFVWMELGAFKKEKFHRNITSGNINRNQRWRELYNNIGIFRSVLFSNTSDFLNIYDEEDTLFYGNLCFDFDVNKEDIQESWKELVTEIVVKLVPRLKQDFDLNESQIHFWFSGGRGFHVEVPASCIGIWPHHKLHRIFGYYADSLHLEYLDQSLYGLKHLYRIENSQHQRTGLYKIPLRYTELVALCDDFRWMKTFARNPRQETIDQLYTTKVASSKSLSFYSLLVKEALGFERPTIVVIGDRNKYDRTRYNCIDDMMSGKYMIPKGSRHMMAVAFATHLRDGGFTFEEATQEFYIWAQNYCDPPATSNSEIAGWTDVLYRMYNSQKSTGCRYIQTHFNSLCSKDSRTCIIDQLKTA